MNKYVIDFAESNGKKYKDLYRYGRDEETRSIGGFFEVTSVGCCKLVHSTDEQFMEEMKDTIKNEVYLDEDSILFEAEDDESAKLIYEVY